MYKTYFLLTATFLLTLFDFCFAQTPIPPSYLHVQSNDLLASWWKPESVLLDENFEGGAFPANWSRTSMGQGWDTATSAMLGLIPVQSCSHFMVVNDGVAGAGNNGCCDYLITPALDLTQYPGYHLHFRSFFTGNSGQLATVEMSTDNGQTWNIIQEPTPYPYWRELDLDLSSWSGPTGLSSVRFAFHAGDQGGIASGWAVDNVKVYSDNLGVDEYQVSLDGVIAGTTAALQWQFDPMALIPGDYYTCCVSAHFITSGWSADTCVTFQSLQMPPPYNYSATASGGDSILFTWSPPLSIIPVVQYNLYPDGINSPAITTTDTSYKLYCPIGQLCVDLTAVYDLTLFGFPGCYAESNFVITCGTVGNGFVPPFYEDWSSGQMELNNWSAGTDWSVDPQVGNEAPSVKYSPPPGKGVYESTLASWYMDATFIDECSPVLLALDYHLKLQDPAETGMDTLFVQVEVSNQLYTIAEYTSNGSFDWLMESRKITEIVRGTNYKILFRCKGISSGNPVTWNIDNISVNESIICFPPPMVVNIQRMGNPEDDLLVTWYPESIYAMQYVLDDGSQEEMLGLDHPGQLWIGNEFPATDEGVLQQVSLFMNAKAGSSAQYSIDIYDSNRNLAGSSDVFSAENGVWTEVQLPDIPFHGMFYAMLHIECNEFSDELGIDQNGPNAPTDYNWVYDGTTWHKIGDSGLNPGVFLLRVKALTAGERFTLPGPGDNSREDQSSKRYYQPLVSLNSNSLNNSALSDCDTIGYSIYRRAYSSYPPGGNPGTGEWEWRGCTPKEIPEFIDQDLSNDLTNCYEYSIAVIYPQGESLPSGSAWSCIYVGLPEKESDQIIVFPNPANQWVRFELDDSYQKLTITDFQGKEIRATATSNGEVIFVNTSHFNSGAYLVIFTRNDGSSFTRKLLVQH